MWKVVIGPRIGDTVTVTIIPAPLKPYRNQTLVAERKTLKKAQKVAKAHYKRLIEQGYKSTIAWLIQQGGEDAWHYFEEELEK
jgi:hypothetical protein